jgi:hypothetical protein
MLLSLPSVVLGAKRLGANRLGGETTCIHFLDLAHDYVLFLFSFLILHTFSYMVFT